VRLNHRSGHACVLNSRALELVGISDSTTEPPGTTILRDLTSGVPNGVLLEMDDFLDGKIPPLSKTVLESSTEEASNRLAGLGITSIQDATPSNSVAQWETFRTLKSDRRLTQRVTFMTGASHVSEFLKLGLNFGAGNLELKVGAAKVMVTESGGQLHPGVNEIRDIVTDLHQRGFQVAIHAVNSDAVFAAARAIKLATSLSASRLGNEARHRIEHCSELPPEVLRLVIASGAVVVTQPGFIFSSGQRYAADISISNQQWLYRIGALQNAGVGLGFGSDAPVIDPNPMFGIYSAVTRKSLDGNSIAVNEAIGLFDAIEAYTFGSAYAGHSESYLGMIKPGFLADLVLLDRDITAIEPSELPEIKASRTIIGGSEV
jgi:predicted amidohydrolase YtcJ